MESPATALRRLVDGPDLVLAPGVAGTPQAIITAIHRDTVRLLQLPDTRKTFQGQGLEVAGSTPGHFGSFIKSEIVKWTKVIRESGAKVD